MDNENTMGGVGAADGASTHGATGDNVGVIEADRAGQLCTNELLKATSFGAMVGDQGPSALYPESRNCKMHLPKIKRGKEPLSI